MGKTSIEWSDHSINPLRARNIETGAVGHFCVKCSPGCKHCYSSKMQKPYLTQLEFVAENRPKVELFFEDRAIQEVLRRRKPTDYFWNDMTDMFLADYPDAWIDRCFAAMALTPQHTHMVLTKRSERMREYFSLEDELFGRWSAAAGCMLDGEWIWGNGKRFRKQIEHFISASLGLNEDGGIIAGDGIPFPLPNVRLGVSVEDQQRKGRIDDLRNTPAAVRFLSVEPLLEDIGVLDLTGIHWVIVGGESGSEARPFNIEWARSIVAQCKTAGVACFVKQLGAKPLGIADRITHKGDDTEKPNGFYRYLNDKKGGDWNEWPTDLRVREIPL